MAKIKNRSTAHKAVSAPDRTVLQRIAPAVAWAFMAALFATFAWQGPLGSLSVELGNWYLARDYQPVKASVVERVGKDADGEFKWFAARYEVAGQPYETGRMSLLEDEAIDVPANATVMKTLETALLKQQAITVWVSPRDPGAAVVSRDLAMPSVWRRGLFGGAYALIALGGVLGFVGAAFATPYYRRQKQAASAWVLVAVLWLLVLPILVTLIGPDAQDPVSVVAVWVLGVAGLAPIGYAFYCLFKRE